MPNEKFFVADGEIVGSPNFTRTPNDLAQRRTLLAQQLPFRCVSLLRRNSGRNSSSSI
jgi:hypothetical protein